MPQDSEEKLDNRVRWLLEEARKADRIDKERAELFEAMIKSKGWQEYVMLLEARLQGLSDALLAPAMSVDGMIALEYVKGTMSGLVIARDIPSVTIAAMDQLRRERIQSAEEDDDA